MRLSSYKGHSQLRRHLCRERGVADLPFPWERVRFMEPLPALIPSQPLVAGGQGRTSRDLVPLRRLRVCVRLTLRWLAEPLT
jgi:hypothetical protein